MLAALRAPGFLIAIGALTVLAISGIAAPALAQVTFDPLAPVAGTNTPKPRSGSAMHYTVTPLLVTGDSPPGRPDFKSSAVYLRKILDDGTILFGMTAASSAIPRGKKLSSDDFQFTYVQRPGSPPALLCAPQNLPGLPLEDSADIAQWCRWNGNGDLLFHTMTSLPNPQPANIRLRIGQWADRLYLLPHGSPLRKASAIEIVHTGQAAPGGGTFQSLLDDHDTESSDGSAVAFTAGIKDNPNGFTTAAYIWSRRSGNLYGPLAGSGFADLRGTPPNRFTDIGPMSFGPPDEVYFMGIVMGAIGETPPDRKNGVYRIRIPAENSAQGAGKGRPKTTAPTTTAISPPICLFAFGDPSPDGDQFLSTAFPTERVAVDRNGAMTLSVMLGISHTTGLYVYQPGAAMGTGAFHRLIRQGDPGPDGETWSDFYWPIVRTENGLTIFKGATSRSGEGIFVVAPDGSAITVLRKHDTVNGSPILDFSVSDRSVNAAGQFGIQVFLTDARDAVCIASPSAAPPK